MKIATAVLTRLRHLLSLTAYSIFSDPPPANYSAYEAYGVGCRGFEHVFSQHACGACGAFAASSVYGMRSCKNGGMDLPSPYRVFDCAHGDCNVGLSVFQLEASMRSGVNDVFRTPLVHGWGCLFDGNADILKIDAYNFLCLSGVIKREILLNGPVLGIFMVPDSFVEYVDGVYAGNEDHAEEEVAHAMAVVGWGAATETEPEHWIVQNSWGDDWGQGGRGKLAMSPLDCMVTQV